MAEYDPWEHDHDRHRQAGGRERSVRDRNRYSEDPDHFSREVSRSPDRPGEHNRGFPGGREYQGYGRDRGGMGQSQEGGRGWDLDDRGYYGPGPAGEPRRGRERGLGQDREDWSDRGQTGRGGYSGRDRSLGEMAFGRDQSGRDDPYRPDRGRDERRGGFFGRMGEEVASWFGGSDDEEHLRRLDLRDGAHRGRGPKSYQRSDERILEDVNDRLTDDPQLDASDVEVSVSGREVTLSGTVSNRYDKRRAEDLADSVSGVIHVQNNLRVRGTSGRTSWSDEGSANRTDITGVGHSAGARPDKAES